MVTTLRTYNSTTQTVTSAVTPLALLGTAVRSGGTSVCVSGTNATVFESGKYYLSADVTFTPTAAGTEIIQLYKDGVPMPCAIAQATATVGAVTTVHIETVVPIKACGVVQPVLTVRASGAAVGVNYVAFTAVKMEKL